MMIVRNGGRLMFVLAMIVCFGVTLMGCATTGDLQAVEQKVQQASDKADKALGDAQAAKAAATDAASKANAAAQKAMDSADKADKAAGRAEMAAKAAADSASKADAMAKKSESLFMKRMKK